MHAASSQVVSTAQLLQSALVVNSNASSSELPALETSPPSDPLPQALPSIASISTLDGPVGASVLLLAVFSAWAWTSLLLG